MGFTVNLTTDTRKFKPGNEVFLPEHFEGIRAKVMGYAGIIYGQHHYAVQILDEDEDPTGRSVLFDERDLTAAPCARCGKH